MQACDHPHPARSATPPCRGIRSGNTAVVRLYDLEEGVREGRGLIRRANVTLDEGEDLFQPLAEAAVPYRVLGEVDVDVVADCVFHLRRARSGTGHGLHLLPEVGG